MGVVEEVVGAMVVVDVCLDYNEEVVTPEDSR